MNREARLCPIEPVFTGESRVTRPEIGRKIHSLTTHSAPRPLPVLSLVPNLLTFSRIAACPVLVLVLHDRAYDLALVVFLLAGCLDCQCQLGLVLDVC